MAVGETMAQEALDELKEKGIPVYAACIRDTALDHINSFGEFARRLAEISGYLRRRSRRRCWERFGKSLWKGT